MATQPITLDVETGPLRDVLARLLQYDRAGLNETLARIGRRLVETTRERAGRQVDPDGHPWAPLTPRYLARKKRKRPNAPILRLDNHLLGDQLSSQVLGDEVFVGTNAVYGAIHQFGGDINFPARSQTAYFKRDGRTGKVGNRFVNKAKSNFAQGVTLPAYRVKIPKRPFLGLSAQDEQDVLAIAIDGLLDTIDGPGGASA